MAAGDRIYIADKQTLDLVKNGTVEVTDNTGLEGLTLSGTYIDTNGNIVLGGTPDGTTTGNLSDGSSYNVYSSNAVAQGFIAEYDKYILSVDLKLGKVGAPQDKLTVELRNASGEVPGSTVYATAEVSPSDIPSNFTVVTVTFPIPYKVTTGTKYTIVLSAKGCDSSNYYQVRYQGTNVYAGGYQSYNNSFISSPTAFATQASFDLYFLVRYGVDSLSGTATITIDRTKEYAFCNWHSLLYNAQLPANTNVTADILDENDNSLKSNVTSGQSLFDIDRDLYKKIKVRFTLSRTSVGAQSPTLNGINVRQLSRVSVLAPQIYVAGTRYKLENPNEYVSTTKDGSNYASFILVYKFVPEATGEILVQADLQFYQPSGTSGGAANLSALSAYDASYRVIVVGSSILDFRTPLGTKINSSNGLTALFGTSNPFYQTFSTTLFVTERIPIYFVFNPTWVGCKIRNFKIMYDKM
jgi:hypothetical protein